jgi:NitT/TauT family transport system substrate-binding protein
MSDLDANWTRRAFVGGLALAGTAGLLVERREPAAGEPPPETFTLRIQRPVKTLPGVCVAPQLVADELLKLEGFTDVRYVATDTPQRAAGLAGGEIDLSMGFVGGWIKQVDAGHPIVMLTGIHVGCFELFASEHIRTIGDLRGKTIGVTELGSSRFCPMLV